MVAPACDCRLRFAQRPSRDPPLVGDAETRHQPRGAGEGNRTLDLLITNQLLCRLSYASVEPKAYFAKTSARLHDWPGTTAKTANASRAAQKRRSTIFPPSPTIYCDMHVGPLRRRVLILGVFGDEGV